MKKIPLQMGQVVQLSPNTSNKAFACCMMVVTEPKSWGAQGYVQSLGQDRNTMGGQAYYRAKFEEMELVGQVTWMPKN